MASTSSQEHSATDSLLQETEEFLQNRIEKTRSEIRRVDLFSMFLALLTVGAGMVFIGILLDHLLFSAGLSLKGRTLYFIFTVIILLVIFASRLRAVLKYRINPLFAAKALEEHKPGLKNALINWYQLRTTAKTGADEKSIFLRQVFLQGVSVQAAREVQTIPQEMVVDHFPVIRWGIALAVLTVLFAGYTLFSAKSVFVSVGRLTLPLANIAPPQSVRFLLVSPGNVQLFQKDSVTVQAEITGVGNSSVWLVFSTLDNRLVDRKIPMQATGGKMYETKFPLSDDGFSESLEYYIAVGIGDSKEIRSDTFTVDVRPEIMFTVEKLTCRYPKYTGLAPQTFNNLGDIHALEGTEVELVGKSNITMKKAFFIPDQDEKLAKIMTIIPDSPDKATYLFSLTSDSTRNSSDVSSNPVYHNYQIRCMDEEGNENRYPVNYRIETVSDVPPIIKWESVQEEDTVTEIPSNQPFSVKVRAEDPDFGLRSVQLHCLPTTSNETGARLLNSQKKTIELLLPVSDRTVHASMTQDSAGTVTADDTPSPYTGQKVLQGIILPEDLGFAIGTEVEYWCEAIDSKFPFPNSTSTDKRLFTVTEPVATPAPLPEDSGNQDHSGEEESADPNSDSRKTDEKENSAAQEKQNQQSDDNQNQEGKQTESDPDNNEQKNSKDSQQKNGRQNSENSANQGAGQQQDRNQNDNPSNQQQQKNQGNSGENQGAKPENPQDTQADNNQKGGGGNNADNSDESTPDSQNQGNDNENQTDNSLSDNQEQSSDTSSSEEGSGGGQADDKESSGQSGANPSPSSGKNNTPEPIDPHANPGDAFETILDYMNQHNESPSAGSGSADSENQINDSTETDQKTDPRESNKNAKQQNSGNQPESSETNEPETEQENQSSATPETPPQNGTPDQRKTEPRSMPETTSNKEADPNAQRYRD
ncbi:MAG: hypothetical protein IKW74_01635, partial [Thermoguttaceae bacterium]|nr:hypothetical protein [Thermoguttaceae bacterium]